ncbi:carbohydrate kinase [Iocasia frigidifontis]|uniref:Carbohydrate kinase n=1 Tax=Iocasia fonsfrigidae TaxID=2682810 RepID=A0A8A7K9P4_9FIRM|nr:PfkB family carbohydrate kinase [Iocasia fonsfrigidae]QTL97950.1 carbohydrate kinase [Iocasia fonsfrigidae]
MTVDIVTMGEMLIDFVPLKKGLALKDNEGFLRMPGGAPANVAVGTAKLGIKSAFLGKVGADPFGDLLIDTLRENSVNVEGIVQSNKAKTTLAFVTLDEKGDRDFTFYRDPGADMLYDWDEVNLKLLKKARVFHHGSISLIDEPVRSTTLRMAETANDNGLIVSYDPNLRIPLWPDLKQAEKWIKEGLKTADLLKISEEELEFITGESSLKKGARRVMAEYNVKLIFITLGAEGSYFYNGLTEGMVSGFKVNAQDTTGAGDAFTAGILAQLINEDIDDLSRLDNITLKEMLKFSNAVGAITTTGKGAISSLPNLKSVRKFLKKTKI